MRPSLLLVALALLVPFLAPHPAAAIDAGSIDVDALPLPFPPKHADVSYPYVIVTTKKLSHEFHRLAQQHTHDGLRAGVWTIESIHAAYPAGRDDAERIRMFLQDAYRELDTRWLLLGGSDELIPIRVVPVPQALTLMPTDQYYACLDGTWNADGDDTWGELDSDDVDCAPELNVGRAPVADAEEAHRFVDKTLDALKRQRVRTSWQVLFAAEILDFAHVDMSHQAERLRPLIEPVPGVQITRLYENDAAWPGAQHETRQTLKIELDRGYDLAVLWGAGAPYAFECGAPNEPPGNLYYDSDAAAMKNTHATIVCFSSSSVCRPSPDYPSLGERMVTARYGEGASAVLGPTTVEFVGLNADFLYRVLDHVYEHGTATIGEALTQTIDEFPNPGDVTRLATQGMILYGDPALPMSPPATVQTVAATAEADDAVAAIPSSLTLALQTPSVTADVAAGDAGFSLRAVSANPARTEARLELALPAALAAQRPEVGVFDLAGRQVRALDSGKRTLSWDLRDDAGSPVVSGVYFVNVRVAGRTATRRVVVTR